MTIATTTAADEIYAALRLIGQLAEGETPSSETVNDALKALNTMIDSWSTESLMIYNTQDQVFTWPASTAKRTLGPTGDFVGNRPVGVDDSTYFRDPTTGVSFGIKIINQQQYDGIAVKTVTSTYPQIMWINMENPNISITIYPVPTRALEWHIISVDELVQPAKLATHLVFPPGYMRAFKYNLAVEFAAEFGVEPPPTVSRIAMASKRNLQNQNQDDSVMAMPYAIMTRRGRFNIYSGAP
jgi:hypothetical protein